MTDCMTVSSSSHEPFVQHVKRVVHNIFHPFHKIKAPSIPVVHTIQSQVCVAPELETVTVSTDMTLPNDLVNDGAYGDYPRDGWYSSYPYNYGGYYGGGGGTTVYTVSPSPIITHPPRDPSIVITPPYYPPVKAPEVSVDEPSTAILFFAGMMAVLISRYSSRKIKL